MGEKVLYKILWPPYFSTDAERSARECSDREEGQADVPWTNSVEPLKFTSAQGQSSSQPHPPTPGKADSIRGTLNNIKSIIYNYNIIYSTSQSLDTPTHSRGFLHFYYFIYCRIIVKTSTL